MDELNENALLFLLCRGDSVKEMEREIGQTIQSKKNNSPRPAKNFVVDFVFFFLSVSRGGERNLDGTEPTLERWDFIDSEVDLMNKEPPPLGLVLVSVINSAKPVGVTTL